MNIDTDTQYAYILVEHIFKILIKFLRLKVKLDLKSTTILAPSKLAEE